ncbi:HNH endonuclease [Streptomyces laculatispora]|uniref:HNH endonuclease n=1 Tax=Streptomyces laculatispora TaxID=887464 RepID=A0ABY9I9F0_9ACTN|nr:HNH endonuclease [Streptomyces laculatispora]WLQ43299.1 HNH endonuclease [Streptomyces laculatispora]
MRNGAISRDGVFKALTEYDELGQEGFLSKYGYKPSTGYFLLHEERTYDSKAIAGVAHKFDQGRALRPDELSGGRSHAARSLARLGFTIRSSRSPDWTRDEIILACDLAMVNGWKRLEFDDLRVIELSALLQTMPIHPEELRNELFRNPNGVARKTVDITSRHPDYTGKPTNGNALDVEVMNDFLARPAEMSEVARRIRQGLVAGEFQDLPTEAEEEDDYSAPEGRLLLLLHRSRERNKALRKRKIDAVLRQGRQLACEACGFDFEHVYGDRGRGYIECHHVVPLHQAGEGRTKLSDLALICANCHRMIHRHAPWPTPRELRASMEQKHAADRRAAEALARPRRAADDRMPKG